MFTEMEHIVNVHFCVHGGTPLSLLQKNYKRILMMKDCK